jgi:gamma-glutamyltranspeptidase / glutathione hydrolase
MDEGCWFRGGFHWLIALLALLLVCSPLSAAPILAGERMQPVQGQNGMLVTSHPLATAAGLAVLKQGGNAVDAAVTVAFVLAVVQPRSGNLGGGGFMLISSEQKDQVVAVDYRETAPAGATRDMFLDAQGEVDNEAARFSHLAAGVPGSVAGLAMTLEQYGTLSLAQALAPAIRLAQEGFVVTPHFSAELKEAAKQLKRWEATRKIFYQPDGDCYEPGERFVQPQLAATLQRIATHGAREFYTGKTAELLVAEMQRYGGLISRADLRQYTPVIRTPVQGSYRGFEVYSMPPPSSGGVHLIELLNVLEGYPIGELGHNAAQTIHLLAEAMKWAYADRSQYLGDSDFVAVPLRTLTSKAYAAAIRAKIDGEQATPSSSIAPGRLTPYESDQTTHFSVVDRFGNAVANTTTLNFSYGSGIVVAGAGFLLNNEMDDFSAKPGVPNAYGLLGGAANRIEPGKRMLSSMAPTIVKQDGRNFLVTGSPGGARIITTVLQVLMNVIDHGLNIQSAVAAPRIHHQWLPDELRSEEGISPDTVRLLEGMGHRVIQQPAMGASQSILLRDGVM